MKPHVILLSLIGLCIDSYALNAAEPRSDAYVTPTKQFARKDPEVHLKWHYAEGVNSIERRFPTEKQLETFPVVEVYVNGKRAKFVDPIKANEDFFFSRKVVLKPGESFECDVSLGKVFVIPEDWTSLEIRPGNVIGFDGFIYGLKIQEQTAVEKH